VTLEVLYRGFDIRDDFIPLPPFIVNTQVESGSSSPPTKKSKLDGSEESESDNDSEMEVSENGNSSQPKKGKKRSRKLYRQPEEPGMITTNAFPVMRGHTSFLTFARKPVTFSDS